MTTTWRARVFRDPAHLGWWIAYETEWLEDLAHSWRPTRRLALRAARRGVARRNRPPESDVTIT